MRRLSGFALVCVALAAGFAGALGKDWLLQAAPVLAQDNPAPPIKIGLFDLERACKASGKFNSLKRLYEEAKAREEAKAEQLNRELELKKSRLRMLLQSNADSKEPAILRPEIAALEEYLKRYSKFLDNYLVRLLDEYQKQVIEHVTGVAMDYCTAQGYHLVLQDFVLNRDEMSDMFAGASMAERWLNKPVLFTPRVVLKENPYVTDITEDIINQVKGGG